MVKIKKEKEKIFYKTKDEYTYEEYYKLFESKTHPFLKLVIYNLIPFAFLCWLASIIFLDNYVALIIFIFLAVVITIKTKITYADYIYKQYSRILEYFNGLTINTKTFYDEYFIFENKENHSQVYYNNVIECIETKTNVYLKLWDNRYYSITKNEKTDGIGQFLKDHCTKAKYRYNSARVNIKYPKETNNELNNKTKTILNILLYLNIAGIAIPVIILFYTIISNNFHLIGNELQQYNYIYYIFSPIPIASIIYGIVCQRKGYNCKNNIIIGIFILIFFFVFGTLDFSSYQDYANYSEVGKINIPPAYETITKYKSERDYKELKSTKYKFDESDAKNLENSIKTNDKWIISKNIDSKLNNLIPDKCNGYVLIYNLTLNEYNTIPNGSDNYKFIVMCNSQNYYQLQVYQFKYHF